MMGWNAWLPATRGLLRHGRCCHLDDPHWYYILPMKININMILRRDFEIHLFVLKAGFTPVRLIMLRGV
jgi:hypothetical protein